VCTGAPLSAISGTTGHLDLTLLGGLQAKAAAVDFKSVSGSDFSAYFPTETSCANWVYVLFLHTCFSNKGSNFK
jgi:hypothetical protein